MGNKKLKVLLTVLGVILILMSLLLLIVSPVAGIIGILFGGLVIFYGSKMYTKLPPEKPKKKYELSAVGLFAQPDAREIFEEDKDDENTFFNFCTLTPEPDNEHDPNAVAVYVYQQKIGYVRRDQCDLAKSIIAAKGSTRILMEEEHGDLVGTIYAEVEVDDAEGKKA